MSDISPLITRQIVPDLQLPLVGGDMWSLRQAGAENFSLLVFYRGWHCPLCRTQLARRPVAALRFLKPRRHGHRHFDRR